jgi:parallel beta-helix repeat protein
LVGPTYSVSSSDASITSSAINPATGAFTWTPGASEIGAQTINFSATDGTTTESGSVAITVTAAAPADAAPVAADQSVTTDENTPVAITLGATDADAGDTLTYATTSDPAHGTLSGAAPNLTYSPASGYTGTDSFQFKANDGTEDSNIAAVSITVNSAGGSGGTGGSGSGSGPVENITHNLYYDTIQAAVDAASSSDVIQVAAGTYAENVTIGKPLTLKGANAGVSGTSGSRSAESIISGSGGAGVGVSIDASGVTVDGFTITGAASTGVFIDSSSQNVTVSDNIITDNSIGLYGNCAANCLVQHNEFTGNNRTGSAGGAGIYTDQGSHGLTIDSNDFTNHQINSAIIFAATADGTNSDAAVSNNTYREQ